MFDRTVYATQSMREYVPYDKTIIEKRAPTDDSIRLYEEIKEKSYNSIIDTIKVNDNIFNVKAIVYNDLLAYTRKCKFAFNINGHEITGSVDLDFDDEYNRDKCMKNLYYKCAEKLSIEMMNLVYKDLTNKYGYVK